MAVKKSKKARQPATVVAIANQKGGVGKSTTAINLSACLAGFEQRILIVDLDPQGNATSGLGIDRDAIKLSIYDVLLGEEAIPDIVEPTNVKNLFLGPATIDLAGAEIELVSVFSRESRLDAALKDVADDYDFVLVDCPPIPIQCEYYALEGVSQLLRNVELVKDNLNPRLTIGGVLLTMHDGRTNLSSDVAKQVREFFGEAAYDTVVPRSVRLSEAPSYGEPIESFDPMSRGAIAYRQAAREFLERHGRKV